MGVEALKRRSFIDTPVIVIGVFLMLVSLADLIGACCRVNWLLWLYLVVMFLLILIGIYFTIFTFTVTNKGAGHMVSRKGYKEYRLGDYSNWLQKRFNNPKNWNKIQSCLIDSKVCSTFNQKYLADSVDLFYTEHLSAVQSGCYKPATECGSTYTPTNWTKTGGSVTSNLDCDAWKSDPGVLCFNCESCKAAVLDNL